MGVFDCSKVKVFVVFWIIFAMSALSTDVKLDFCSGEEESFFHNTAWHHFFGKFVTTFFIFSIDREFFISLFHIYAYYKIYIILL